MNMLMVVAGEAEWMKEDWKQEVMVTRIWSEVNKKNNAVEVGVVKWKQGKVLECEQGNG